MNIPDYNIIKLLISVMYNAYQIKIPNVKHKRVANITHNNHTQHFSLD